MTRTHTTLSTVPTAATPGHAATANVPPDVQPVVPAAARPASTAAPHAAPDTDRPVAGAVAAGGVRPVEPIAGAAPRPSPPTSAEDHAVLDAEDSAAAQALAEAVGAAMFARDPASQGLGMTLDAIAPGYARMSMHVRDDMLNGHQTCHGGFIFSLADSAFAFACNSRNHTTVGAGCSIDYLSPGRAGDLLTATAVEQSLSGKTGIYDITVNNQHGRTIALFRGKSHRISGEVL